MPELPEVETVARTLAPALSGRSLVRIEVINAGTWQGGRAAEDVCCGGARPLAVPSRRGKVLLLNFSDMSSRAQDENAIFGLAFHLKMSGRLFAYAAEEQPAAHTRLILHLDDKSQVFFDDTRKFGYVRALSRKELAHWDFWQKLGAEPLEISQNDFITLFRARSGSMKSLLLDQSLVAGIGNIYADESLFRAGINPAESASAVSAVKLGFLHGCLQEVLLESINACGSSIKDYRTARGDAGAFQNAFRVYGRSGKNCVVCGTPLESAKIAGRTTVFCPKCQKKSV